MTPVWDIVVVGAGPAGSRAAELFARAKKSVLLLDPKAPWEKPCGGGLTAAALHHTPELRELAPEALAVRELLVVGPRGSSVVIPIRHPYLVVSRLRLAQWGLERARAAGVRFVSAWAREIERQDGVWRIADSLGDEHHARWLLAADGATSRLRLRLAPGLRPELAPTRVSYPGQGAPDGRAVFAFLPVAQGYLWDFPRPGHHSVGIGVAPGTFARPDLDGALAQYRMAEVGEDRSVDERGAVIATSNWEQGRFRDLAGPGFALLGDAAGLADPATGEGIDYALRSAALAAASFDESRGFEGYPAAARRAFRKEMRRARLIRGWLYRPGLVERLVHRARRSPRAALLLMSLADAVNEHGPLSNALFRAMRRRPDDREASVQVCQCPDGVGHLPHSPGQMRPRGTGRDA